MVLGTFIVRELNARGVALLFGPKRTFTSLIWSCLEGIPELLRNRRRMRIGANRDRSGNPGTLDAYLKGCLKRQTADYVAVVLDRSYVPHVNMTADLGVLANVGKSSCLHGLTSGNCG